DGRTEPAEEIGNIIQTAAGTGLGCDGRGDDPPGSPATQTRISSPANLAMGADGSLYIANSSTRVRRVGPDGIVTLVNEVNSPGPTDRAGAIAVGPDGSVYASGAGPGCGGGAFANRVRRVHPDGHVEVVAGTGGTGFSGDNGPALGAQLNAPLAMRSRATA